MNDDLPTPDVFPTYGSNGITHCELAYSRRFVARMLAERKAELATLRAELAALQADAERYRWLRNFALDADAGIFIGVASQEHPNRWALAGKEADAAIDVARAADQT